MKKKEALAIMDSRVVAGEFDVSNMTTKDDVERQIRAVSDNDERFENAIFELGCSVLAKQYLKSV